MITNMSTIKRPSLIANNGKIMRQGVNSLVVSTPGAVGKSQL